MEEDFNPMISTVCNTVTPGGGDYTDEKVNYHMLLYGVKIEEAEMRLKKM
jgi:hypothetical protein